MIIVASPTKPIPVTDKGTVKRGTALEFYSEEIEAAYLLQDCRFIDRIRPPSYWSLTNTLSFIRETVVGTLGNIESDTSNLFEYGCDSLEAIFLRKAIVNALTETIHLESSSMPQDVVYQYPSIFALSQLVSDVATNPGLMKKRDTGVIADQMKELVRFHTEYIGNLSSQVLNGDIRAEHRPDTDTVFITGTTGSFGSHILIQLINSTSVGRVYAFNRRSANGTPLRLRQRSAFERAGVNPDLLTSSGKVVLIEGDLKQAEFGLEKLLYEELLHSVTHLIHTAWPVDFNLNLEMFHNAILGVRHLVEFSLSSKLTCIPRMIFISSVGVFHNSDTTIIEEDILEDPSPALGTGYSESKWVAERILLSVAEVLAFRPIIIRVGQLVGSKCNVWKTTEWMPALVKSSVYLGQLPSVEGEVSWLPVDIAAQAVVESRNATAPILHLVHPTPVPFETIACSLSKLLKLPLVTFSEWLVGLRAAGSQGLTKHVIEQAPALKLLPFFEDLERSSHSGGEAFGMPKARCCNVIMESKAVRHAPSLCFDDVNHWVKGWKLTHFLSNAK
ncbi:hypothetical protein M422DRAFT_260946 [Sphaerobolus stellatus SS14]|uniref:Thioester reductase (TE) domain-containing protein n=1 Tax=Sphaerobolus stellatus (strain SS14) TaxID=990650 RepID=A0A0C9U1D4_SPHS4|nr:hypothetical protein M422DRAFT_260946 [Sphaerobolus stellatus SS14]